MADRGVAAEVESLTEDWRRERPDVDLRSLRVSLPLRRVLQLAEEHRSRVLARYGVTAPAFDMLVALRRTGAPYERTPSELAETLVLSSGGVSQRLDKLEQAGLVERRVAPDDRRSVCVRLTTEGVKLLDRLFDEYMAHEDALFAGLSLTQADQLQGLLVQLESSIAAVPLPDVHSRTRRTDPA